MTFSITAFDQTTGQVGVAITTSSICVGARCPWVRAGVGAVATQNVTLPSLAPDILEFMAQGQSPQDALGTVMAADPHQEYRQVCVVDTHGNTAVFSGSQSLGINGDAMGRNCVAGGNLLANDKIPKVLVSAFENSTGHLANRLLTALQAGMDAGGEMGPVHSAALVVADKHKWDLVNLRVDWAENSCPVSGLWELWRAYEPQMQDYITRALNPTHAPSYGVPGDE